MAKLKPVKSLGELFRKAANDAKYKKLLFAASENLGGPGEEGGFEAAKSNLLNNAYETDEEGVVDEVNFVIDLID